MCGELETGERDNEREREAERGETERRGLRESRDCKGCLREDLDDEREGGLEVMIAAYVAGDQCFSAQSFSNKMSQDSQRISNAQTTNETPRLLCVQPRTSSIQRHQRHLGTI